MEPGERAPTTGDVADVRDARSSAVALCISGETRMEPGERAMD